MLNSQYIGNGKYRIIVRRRDKLARLRNIPGIIVDGNRVIFPEWLAASVEMIVRGRRRRRKPRPVQEELFDVP